MSDNRTIHLSVEAAYDRWAGFYDGYDNPMVFVAGHAVASLAPMVAGKDVFEFGCGTGRNLTMLKGIGAAGLAGCDLSAGMLEQARRRDSAFRLIRHDMTSPFAQSDGSADLALFCLSLEHVGDLAAPLGEARRILRPGGRIAIVEIHPFLAISGVAAHFEADGSEVHMPTFAHRFSDYLNTFATLGLAVEHCREWCPRDLAVPVPAKVLKRGMDTPLAVQFILRA